MNVAKSSSGHTSANLLLKSVVTQLEENDLHLKASTTRTATKTTLLCIVTLSLSACGTTYTVPDISPGSEQVAKAMFAEEAGKGVSDGYAVNPRVAAQRYNRVISRVEPVAEKFCRTQMAETRPDYNCDVTIVVDTDMPERNAYQTTAPDGTPIIAFTVPMLMDARNDDEIAFVMGHEYGHHIATHIEKAEQQAVAGAIIMGSLMAVGQAYASSNNPYRYTGNDAQDLENAMAAGYMMGDRAFSQTYELESDVIATHLARAAGYDPVKGARFFARPEAARTETGKLSFWGTHPPDEKRLALVVQTNSEIDAKRGLQKR